jgi:hypothetical protein
MAPSSSSCSCIGDGPSLTSPRGDNVPANELYIGPSTCKDSLLPLLPALRALLLLIESATETTFFPLALFFIHYGVSFRVVIVSLFVVLLFAFVCG